MQESLKSKWVQREAEHPETSLPPNWSDVGYGMVSERLASELDSIRKQHGEVQLAFWSEVGEPEKDVLDAEQRVGVPFSVTIMPKREADDGGFTVGEAWRGYRGVLHFTADGKAECPRSRPWFSMNEAEGLVKFVDDLDPENPLVSSTTASAPASTSPIPSSALTSRSVSPA
jgi:hypothetical protein